MSMQMTLRTLELVASAGAIVINSLALCSQTPIFILTLLTLLTFVSCQYCTGLAEIFQTSVQILPTDSFAANKHFVGILPFLNKLMDNAIL
jgi:hypothetical protein